MLAAVNEYLGDPILLGLTATPPDDATKDNEDARRYREYFGPVDYEVPVPAVIKDGFLAPYQDLAYFVRPNSNELNFVAQTSEAMDALISELCNPPKDKKGQPVRESLQDYAERILANTELPTRKVSSWLEFENMASAFALSARLFLYHRGQSFPEGVPELSDMVLMQASDPLEQVVPLLSWYVRNRLRASPEFADHDLAERVIKRLRIMGIQITETGTMHCASPVTRVLAYSRAKAQALIPILKEEIKVLGDTIRAVVLCDYEKTAAIAGEISHVLDEEAGGAIAAFRELLNDEETDALDPVLLTGSTVFVDDDFKPTLEQAIREWLSEKGKSVDFTWGEESGFYVLLGKGSDWCPRVYVEMFTELFLSGLTRCLVGTRGLLAEGWDAKKINVLLDLTCVSTSTAVNQLRGRSFRLDPDVPEKLANNWDVVCIAPEFTRGMDDYRRFRRKHKQIFGVTDGGAIEKGVGHVHPGFKERGVEGIEDNMAMLNRDMLERVAQRAHFRGLWRIGEPYHPEPIKAVEIKGACDEPPGAGFNFPPLKHRTAEWTDGTLTQEIGRVILLSLAEIGMVDQDNVSEIIERISVAERTGGYTRVFLEEVDEKTSDLFAQAIAEVFGPLTKARYVIPRVADVLFRESWFSDTWFYRVLPQDLSSIIVKKTLRDKYRRQIVKFHALPRELGRNKERALVYQKHWNEHVSPGEVLFQGKNFKQMLLEEIQRMSDLPSHAAKLSDEAKIEGLLPSATVNVKEVFI